MKTIISYVADYFRAEWDARYFTIVGCLLGGLFFLNYGYGFERAITSSLSFPSGHIAFYFGFYFLPYLITHAAYAVVKRNPGVLRTRQFWTLSVGTFVVLAVYIALHDGPWYLLRTHPALFADVPKEFQPFATRCASNVLPLTLMGIPLIAYWWRLDSKTMPLYGFTAKTIDLRPYFVLLLFLLPIVAAASFTPDFIRAYPRYKFGFPSNLGAGEQRPLIGIFELCYGADFVFVEFFFRGFMILAFARLLGSKAILPMVVVYALIHFEKPLLEALSSILGGLVLGIISYRTKSVYGGVIMHLGIAFMMEIGGTLQMMAR